MSENQALIDAIRTIVGEAVAPLSEKFDGLAERVETRLTSVETRLTSVETRLTSIETRLTSIEDRVGRLEEIVERLETRTGQLSRELFDLQDRMDRGFASVKSETTLALKDLGAIKQTQQADQKKIRQLEKKVAALQQRLDALENAQAAQSQ
jgi:chromosome segregation ATPase